MAKLRLNKILAQAGLTSRRGGDRLIVDGHVAVNGLVTLSPATLADPALDARAIVEELRKYDEALYRKPRWLVLNKIDLVPGGERGHAVQRFLRNFRWRGKSFIISALTGEGCRELVFAVMKHLEQDSGSRSQDSVKARRLTKSLNPES